MPDYRVIYFYRNEKHNPETDDLTTREGWDGQQIVEISLDKHLGDGDGDIEAEWDEIRRAICLKGGFAEISVSRLEEMIDVEASAFHRSDDV